MKLPDLLVVLVAAGFAGEVEYLSRLRCPDGTPPQFQGLTGREAHGLRGPYGNFVNGYRVRCIYLNTEYRVFIDPHHPNYAERAAVPGFVAAGPPDRNRLFWFER